MANKGKGCTISGKARAKHLKGWLRSTNKASCKKKTTEFKANKQETKDIIASKK